MPPVRSGSVSTFTSTANSGSTSITVAADATMLVLWASGDTTTAPANVFSSGTCTLNSVARTGTVQADATATALKGSFFYWTNPATGTQTVAWDFLGTDAAACGFIFGYASYKDLDTASPLRDSGQNQNTSSDPYTTATLTAQSGDLIIAACDEFGSGGGTFTWTGATKILDFTDSNSCDGSWAEASPTGNQTVSVASPTYASDGGVAAMVVKPAASLTTDIVFSYANYPKPKLAYER